MLYLCTRNSSHLACTGPVLHDAISADMDTSKISLVVNMATVAGFSHLQAISIHTERVFCSISHRFDL